MGMGVSWVHYVHFRPLFDHKISEASDEAWWRQWQLRHGSKSLWWSHIVIIVCYCFHSQMMNKYGLPTKIDEFRGQFSAAIWRNTSKLVRFGAYSQSNMFGKSLFGIEQSCREEAFPLPSFFARGQTQWCDLDIFSILFLDLTRFFLSNPYIFLGSITCIYCTYWLIKPTLSDALIQLFRLQRAITYINAPL